MTLSTPPKVFQSDFENPQKLEISSLGAEMTNIKIWVPLNLSHNFIYFSQIFCK
jgi:hypothetical protein